jgi:transposase-like protein
MKSELSAAHLQDEAAAFAYVEAKLWPAGPVCAHCGTIGQAGRLQGKSSRPGLWKCYACRKPFTVRMGTIFESSHVVLHIWLQVIYLLNSSKKGFSTRQIQRTIGGSMKTAWFLGHRIRECMKPGTPGSDLPPLGGEGEVIEADETYIGTKKGLTKQRGGAHKNVVLSLVERGGSVRSFHIARTSVPDILPIVRANVAKESRLHTDEAKHYERVGTQFAAHEAVNHAAEEYARGDVTTNSVEGFFSVFKRGMTGIYQHCGENHLHRYLTEFDFRHSNRVRLGVDDVQRAERALKGAAGRRLTYRTVGGSRRPQAAPV